MICGTSTGGIIAAGLGLGIPADRILSLYLDEGEEIFPLQRFSEKALRAARDVPFRDRRPLDEKLAREFEGLSYGESKARLVIPSFDENVEPNVWKTDHHPDYQRDWDLPANAIVAATSAAPIYFAASLAEDRVQWDGGLYANNPLMMGLADTLACYDIDRGDIEVLSLGCGQSKLETPAADAGVRSWALNLLGTASSLQSHDCLGQAGLLIGKDSLCRINPAVEVKIELDDYKGAAQHLPSLGSHSFKNCKSELRNFFSANADPRERHYTI
ncbi:hypothetical protein GCM10009069_29060 [Algimonas arctica]|uniref:PNPLA domain-containing protein n=2 Tax=Algimonas arctica TaxID=1479486 RepID=A0A8J3G3K8_9PROT|nr:hypothetical protein GCM10009069_29060 [Algimonas arctica]